MYREYLHRFLLINVTELVLWAVVPASSLPVCAGSEPPCISNAWVATDALGRKLPDHAEMLADAGVDLVVFDCTNGTFTWKEAYDVLGEVWMAARYDGVRTPQFAFLCPFAPHEDSRVNITKIYEDVYKPGRFKDLWFYWKGKPLLMGYPDNLPEPIRSFFTFRPGQPDYRRGSSRPDHGPCRARLDDAADRYRPRQEHRMAGLRLRGQPQDTHRA